MLRPLTIKGGVNTVSSALSTLSRRSTAKCERVNNVVLRQQQLYRVERVNNVFLWQ